jgi:hypothetical protein
MNERLGGFFDSIRWGRPVLIRKSGYPAQIQRPLISKSIFSDALYAYMLSSDGVNGRVLRFQVHVSKSLDKPCASPNRSDAATLHRVQGNGIRPREGPQVRTGDEHP